MDKPRTNCKTRRPSTARIQEAVAAQAVAAKRNRKVERKWRVTFTREATFEVEVSAPDATFAASRAWDALADEELDYNPEHVWDITGDPELESCEHVRAKKKACELSHATRKKDVACVERVCNSLSMNNGDTMNAKQTATAIRADEVALTCVREGEHTALDGRFVILRAEGRTQSGTRRRNGRASRGWAVYDNHRKDEGFAHVLTSSARTLSAAREEIARYLRRRGRAAAELTNGAL